MKSPKEVFCQKQNDYLVYVTSRKDIRKDQAFNHHSFMVLILLFIVVLSLGAVFTYRRIV